MNYFRVLPLINTTYKRFVISTKTFSELAIDRRFETPKNIQFTSTVDNYGAKHFFHHSHVGLQFMSSAYRYFVALCLFHSVLYSVRVLYLVRVLYQVRSPSPQSPFYTDRQKCKYGGSLGRPGPSCMKARSMRLGILCCLKFIM